MMARSQNAAVTPARLGAAAPSCPEMPELDRVGTRIASGLSHVLKAMGAGCSLTARTRRTVDFADWNAALGADAAIARYRTRAIKGGIMLCFPAPLVAALVDSFYGGDGAVDARRTSLGAAEQRLFGRIATQAADAIAAAWAPMADLAPGPPTCQFGTDEVTFAKPADLVLVQSFEISFGESRGGTIEIVYLQTALRALPGLRGTVTGPAPEADPVWRQRLSDAVMQSRLPVRTVIARPNVSLARLMSLAPGDLIPITLPARVPLTVAGRLLAHGTIGEANGRAALKIDHLEQGLICHD